MPEQSDNIFQFDPTSFWKELPQYKRVDYVSAVNKDTGEVVLVPSDQFKTNSEQKIIEQVDAFYYRYNLFKNNLDPEQIEKTAQWLRNESNLLQLVAAQLSFHLIKLYEHLIKVHLKTAPKPSDSEFPPFTLIFDRKGDVIEVKLSLDETEVEKVIEHLKKDYAPGFEMTRIWEGCAKEVLIYLRVSAWEKMEQDLGKETVNNMSLEGRKETFDCYFKGEKSLSWGYEITRVLLDFSLKNCLRYY